MRFGGGCWGTGGMVMLGLAMAVLSAMVGKADAATAILLVPIYEWRLVWSDSRNLNYKNGGLWRPKIMDDLQDFPGEMTRAFDGHDVKDHLSPSAFPVYLGDVWQPGPDPPDFVGTMLIIDTDYPGNECPRGVPCFMRNEAETQYTGILTVTPAKTSFVKVWSSWVLQCKEQTAIGIPQLCAGSDLSAGTCKVESGFANGKTPITFQKPTCPNDFYVLGHIGLLAANGTQTAEDPPAAYKCLHETILRRATGFQTEPFFTGSQPKTSVYNSGLVAMQYARPVSLWHADCQAEACGGWPYCADTITQGLFYASASETLPDNVITGDATTTKPTGPRCLAHFRDCTPMAIDGKFFSNPGGPLNETFTSRCDSELGLRSTEPRVEVRGITSVVPSGIPHLSNLPVTVTIRAVGDVCSYIASRDPDGLAEGEVYINRVLTQWVPGSMTFGTTCSFSIRVPLTGEIKPGPATIEVTTKEIGTLAKRIRDASGEFYTGMFVGRLYVYLDPSQNATVIENVNYNGASCAGITAIKIPSWTQMIQYGSTEASCCMYDGPSTSLYCLRSNNLFDRRMSFRGVACYVPARSKTPIRLQISFNGGASVHEISQQLIRIPVLDANGNPVRDHSANIPGNGALRVYGVSPRVGPKEGGVAITVLGQHFSLYGREKMMCRFRFKVAGRVTDKFRTAQVIDDQNIFCIAPKPAQDAFSASVEISVDGNDPCNSDIYGDRNLIYNAPVFYYTNDNTPMALPPAPLTPATVSADPRQPGHRLDGNWMYCGGGGDQCLGWPNSPTDIAEFGYFMCLPGFSDKNGNPTNIKYPVWCIRALPLNAAASYQFTMTDSLGYFSHFHNTPSPELHPGYCHRQLFDMEWSKMQQDLDYRLFDMNDESYDYGTEPRNNSNLTGGYYPTQARNLIDRIFSTPSFQMLNGVPLTNGYNMEYMRNELHRIGDYYGFLSTDIALNIEIRFTVARAYREESHRSANQCSREDTGWGMYSGFPGDVGPTGTYIDWRKLNWKNGKPACAPDPRYADKCSSTIRYAPDRPDDIGVMITEPAEATVETDVDDDNLGCGRLRVSFNCSNFTFESCVWDIMHEKNSEHLYSNRGSRRRYKTMRGYCAAHYPEDLGPNYLDKYGGKPRFEDWRYWYRVAPCVRCRNAEAICNALKKSEEIKNNIPVGDEKHSLGDTNFAAEISLGCFGPANITVQGADEDECCDDVSTASKTAPLRSRCELSMEYCVRPKKNYLCARNDDSDPTQCSGQSCGTDCLDLPVCAPKGLR